MNAVTACIFHSLKEEVLCMLLRSSLPVAFWWLAVDGAALDLKCLRKRECKCFKLSSLRRIGEKNSTKNLFRILCGIRYGEYDSKHVSGIDYT